MVQQDHLYWKGGKDMSKNSPSIHHLFIVHVQVRILLFGWIQIGISYFDIQSGSSLFWYPNSKIPIRQ